VGTLGSYQVLSNEVFNYPEINSGLLQHGKTVLLIIKVIPVTLFHQLGSTYLLK